MFKANYSYIYKDYIEINGNRENVFKKIIKATTLLDKEITKIKVKDENDD